MRQKTYEMRAKKRKQDFTRKRKMTFGELIYFMLSMIKESSQNALERFFPRIGKMHVHMSQQAFSAARQKIKWEAFRELFQASVTGSYHEEWEKWRGFRLMAVDGSFIQLPSDPELVGCYGGLGKEGVSATALASLLYDLENDIIVDARIGPVSGNERTMAEEHLQALLGLESFQRRRELVIFDRGYPSHELIKSLQDKEIQYVMRIQGRFIWEKDMPKGREGWVKLGKERQKVRVIQITLDNGERETLITNIGAEVLEYGVFKELYHQRWGIETKYQQVKQRLELENFSGRLVDNIKQDFYAMMTISNMLASFVREANRKVKKEREKRGNKYEYQVNVNHAIGVFKDRLIGVVLEERRGRRVRLMKELAREIKRRVVPIRLEREVGRKERPRKARFHHNHKSNC
jgi:ribosome-associated toxin RatA of RatAB toxin-antitoxin module